MTVASARSGSALQARLTSVLVAGRGSRWCLHGPRFSRCVTPKRTTLHDREADPTLTRDVTQDHPEEAATMAAHATQWVPEGAREYMVFDASHALVARPALEGGYRTELRRRSDQQVVDDDAQLARLQPYLPDALPLRTEERSAESLEALRALGYVE